MQNYSLDGINPLFLKNFLRKLCIVVSRYSNKDKILETATKDMLTVRIMELEEELHQTRQERNTILHENRNKIIELNSSLLSIKTQVNKLLEAKRKREERTEYLEKKIWKRVK